MDRRVRIGTVEVAQLLTIDAIVNLKPFAERVEPISGHGVLLGSLLQCGARSLALNTSREFYRKLPAFVRAKIHHAGPSGASEVYRCLDEAFARHFSSEELSSNELGPVAELHLFLLQLLLGLHSGTSVVSFLGMPDIDRARPLLPAELLIPCEDLFACLVSVEPSVVGPDFEVATRDVAVFEEILLSSAFEQYEEAHASIEDGRVPIEDCIDQVQASARKLVSESSRLLRRETIRSTILPTSIRGVATALGGLPKGLGELAASLVSGWTGARNRIAVYNLYPRLESLLTSRFRDLAKAAESDLDDSKRSS